MSISVWCGRDHRLVTRTDLDCTCSSLNFSLLWRLAACCCLSLTGMLGWSSPGWWWGERWPSHRPTTMWPQARPGPAQPSTAITNICKQLSPHLPHHHPPPTRTTHLHQYNELKSPRTHLKIWVDGGQNEDSRPTHGAPVLHRQSNHDITRSFLLGGMNHTKRLELFTFTTIKHRPFFSEEWGMLRVESSLKCKRVEPT